LCLYIYKIKYESKQYTIWYKHFVKIQLSKIISLSHRKKYIICFAEYCFCMKMQNVLIFFFKCVEVVEIMLWLLENIFFNRYSIAWNFHQIRRVPIVRCCLCLSAFCPCPLSTKVIHSWTFLFQLWCSPCRILRINCSNRVSIKGNIGRG